MNGYKNVIFILLKGHLNTEQKVSTCPSAPQILITSPGVKLTRVLRLQEGLSLVGYFPVLVFVIEKLLGLLHRKVRGQEHNSVLGAMRDIMMS